MKTLKFDPNIILILFLNLVIICSVDIRQTTASRNEILQRIRFRENILKKAMELENLQKLMMANPNLTATTTTNQNNEIRTVKSKKITNHPLQTSSKIKKLRNIKKHHIKSGVGIVESSTYIRASIPSRIFQCIRKLSILRCMKVFLLQKMEGRTQFTNTGNLTKDFMEQFFSDDKNYPSLTDKRYKNLSDTELTNRLIVHFQKFFKDRDIKLNFIPGVMIQVIPSNENKIKFSLKKNKNVPAPVVEEDYTDLITSGRAEKGKRHKKKLKKQNYKHTMIQMAVPVLMMPAILLGSFLPFILPAFKMATIMSTILNKSALLAALLYAARTTALNQEAEVVHYAYNAPGYH